MKNKITTTIISILVLFSFIANAQNIEKRWKKAFDEAIKKPNPLEEIKILHNYYYPKLTKYMLKHHPENKAYWNSIEWMDNDFKNCEFAIEGKFLEHPSAYQVAFDTVNKQHYNYRSIIITKIIKGSGLKIGDVIQFANEFKDIRGGGERL